MLKLPPDTRIFMAVAPVDMRRSFSGLCAIITETLGASPIGGDLFLFPGEARRSREGDGLGSYGTGDLAQTSRARKIQMAEPRYALHGAHRTGARIAPRWGGLHAHSAVAAVCIAFAAA